MTRFDRITIDSEQMAGVPCIRGRRIPVATVVGLIAEGLTFDEVIAEHPDLEREDIAEALRFAAQSVLERQLPLVGATA
jgi:uncharacterized protein (DUF433 family)